MHSFLLSQILKLCPIGEYISTYMKMKTRLHRLVTDKIIYRKICRQKLERRDLSGFFRSSNHETKRDSKKLINDDILTKVPVLQNAGYLVQVDSSYLMEKKKMQSVTRFWKLLWFRALNQTKTAIMADAGLASTFINPREGTVQGPGSKKCCGSVRIRINLPDPSFFYRKLSS